MVGWLSAGAIGTPGPGSPRHVLMESQGGKDKMEMAGTSKNLYLPQSCEFARAKSSHVVSSESEVREIDPVNAKDCGLSLERMWLRGGVGVGCEERGSLIQSMHHLNEVFQSSDGGINWRSPPKGRHFE